MSTGLVGNCRVAAHAARGWTLRGDGDAMNLMKRLATLLRSPSAGRDRALYLFTRDPRARTRCYGACAVAWPPFYAQARPRAGRGVDAGLLGTIKRRDGRRQETYRGQPLYFYVDDPRGQVLCNDIAEFGGTWYALTAKGDPPGQPRRTDPS